MESKDIVWAEIQAAVESGQPLEDAVFEMLITARRQRDSAIARVRELAEDIKSHRGFWRGGRHRIEEAKTDAAQAQNRAQRLEKTLQGRRVEDRKNAALREAFDAYMNDPNPDSDLQTRLSNALRSE